MITTIESKYFDILTIILCTSLLQVLSVHFSAIVADFIMFIVHMLIAFRVVKLPLSHSVS